MQVRALVLALAVFLAVLPGSVGKDAERELYPDPRKHPASCGRQGLTTSLVCDPSSILAQDESDRVDVVARSVRDDGMIVGVALVKQTGSPRGGKFSCGDAAKGMANKLLASWGGGLNLLVMLSATDAQFCVAQSNAVRPLDADQLGQIYDDVAEILQAQPHVRNVNLVESALTTALLKLRGAVMKNQKVPGTLRTVAPTRKEIFKIILAHCIPFIGFGITDNGLMILFGEAIENFVGKRMGLTTMGAAATGNLLSDIAGIGLGGTIQSYAAWFGFAEPELSGAKKDTSAYRLSKMFGESLGISIGCWIGMAPLLFMKHQIHDAAPVEQAVKALAELGDESGFPLRQPSEDSLASVDA